MRLKEIEERLAQIKAELTTRAAELKEEEITSLEKEVTALQEERAAITAAAEKRSALLARIAAGERLSVEDFTVLGEGLEISRAQQERAITTTSTAVWNTEKHL